ncbi:HAMP domain-containing protein [Altericroceibacterium spongiae]|uniref:histidine kinase n=1 Tax=Altericroceibacterium spongiae TaxID=2320269 RepID=A0A420EQS1_9SPHN|nr:ATP-binding protein [Altericroceibacterium spongiae]RKF23025.1 HAMP domain-containing protein [Altericroceibacterium spongiae]
MSGFWHRLKGYYASLSARMMLLLTIGIAGASITSLLVAEYVRLKGVEQLQYEQVVTSSLDMANRFSRAPAETERLLDDHALFGVRLSLPNADKAKANPKLVRMFEQAFEKSAQPHIQRVTSDCFGGMFDPVNRVAGLGAAPDVECWDVSFRDANGIERNILINKPVLKFPRSATLEPIYLILLVVASALLSFFVARLTTVPLRRLTSAARRFSLSQDPEPIAETGPAEVRTALATFNLMQQRVRDGFRERTQMLAAIAHDLQTPMTRLRLRLERVQDDELRDRLIADLAAMQVLVRDGLELARSSEAREPWSTVDINSLITSLAEDAYELGAPVTLAESCSVIARVKPDALSRCLNNLIENAVKYGGSAEIFCRTSGDMVEIIIRDHGPGFPEGRIEDMLEPFVRGESSRSRETGGTGIGLAIARAQARTFGAVLSLANHSEGGAVASLRFPFLRPDEQPGHKTSS